MTEPVTPTPDSQAGAQQELPFALVYGCLLYTSRCV